MPPKRKITNTKDVRQHGAETKIRESVQLPLRSIIRNRRTEPEIRAYRSRSHDSDTTPIPSTRRRLRSPSPDNVNSIYISKFNAARDPIESSISSSSDDSEANLLMMMIFHRHFYSLPILSVILKHNHYYTVPPCRYHRSP